MNRKIRYFIRKSTLMECAIKEMGKEKLQRCPHLVKALTKGWGCGYAVIPPGHPLYGQEYPDLDVHGGITFSAPAKEIEWPEILPEERDC